MYWGEWGLLPLLSVSACDFLLWLSSLSLSAPFLFPVFQNSSPVSSHFNWLSFTLPISFTLPAPSLYEYFPLPPSALSVSLSLILIHNFCFYNCFFISLSLLNSVSVTVFSCPSIFLFLFCSLFYSLPGLWHPLPPPSLTLSANESFKLRVFGLNCWPIVNAKVWSIESK